MKTLVRKTASISREGFLYGAWNTKGGILGFTPESLFSFSGNHISLTALAGTAPRPGPSLLHDLKEMRGASVGHSEPEGGSGTRGQMEFFPHKRKKVRLIKTFAHKSGGCFKSAGGFDSAMPETSPHGGLGRLSETGRSGLAQKIPPAKKQRAFWSAFWIL